ncbi:hypothetical protein WUBG_02993 [Wuchereria bancrofti]|uniref:Uncharacterized protein n=1 Tax=Wuchereria bancrofti TaxID=6293 RepID=J9BFQ8_WUCBA|nr:hypothetical protein WUBG_02993 [Wuchereria bancrofti]VDM20761.1 unnamed protein product [Wuchereria bancrofti]
MEGKQKETFKLIEYAALGIIKLRTDINASITGPLENLQNYKCLHFAPESITSSFFASLMHLVQRILPQAAMHPIVLTYFSSFIAWWQRFPRRKSNIDTSALCHHHNHRESSEIFSKNLSTYI